ncbi:putative transporter [Wickerhamomyces ciferrii]|uniref:Transporter n=1 Tax=Wickerhamomyces ciferrii (strain ATCC 14091 / BCRC 22168 / CBS 111 / JCM 3599 / NBRC 0793 / NRRL Y-1031 F-60-10) TaxID=1206466 RepID=K0K984_WICCF|nr:putative transporter [Wickerhamomyces ciferrii]CCH41460.1 putative transporter [Wickerhamomyces ciferrii]
MSIPKEKDELTITQSKESISPLSDPNDPLFQKIESQLIKKFDFIIIPCLSLAYLYSNLDKANIGNAQAAGMSEDLGLTGNQYGNVVSLLFVTYVIFEVPIAICLKKIGTRKSLSILTLCFGIVCLCTSFVQNYKSLLAMRMLLGLFESGIIPVINVMLSMCYTKQEMAKRCSIIYSASAAAGAFGGLLAFGLIKINAHGWEGWRWLFAIEGVLTISSFPILVILLPPGDLTQTWWLTTDEKTVLKTRLSIYPDFYQDEKFSWSEIKRSFIDIDVLILYTYEFCVDLTLFGISTFLPSIIKGMGYDKYKTQLLTIPFYSLALLSFMGMAWISDKLQHRGGFLIIGLIMEIIGYSILISQDSLGARYTGCMLISLGIYVCSALSIMWINNNCAGHYKRATSAGMMTTIGSIAGVLAGQIYTMDSAPRYLKGLKITLGLTVLAMVLVIVVLYYYKTQNDKRGKELKRLEDQGLDINVKPENDRSVYFKFML